MLKKLLIFLIFFSSLAKAEVIVNDVVIKRLNKNNFVIYFSAENTGNEVEYISEIEILNNKYKIHKTIFVNQVAKIIEIDRLIVPPKQRINSFDLRIFVPIYNYNRKLVSSDIKFTIKLK